MPCWGSRLDVFGLPLGPADPPAETRPAVNWSTSSTKAKNRVVTNQHYSIKPTALMVVVGRNVWTSCQTLGSINWCRRSKEFVEYKTWKLPADYCDKAKGLARSQLVHDPGPEELLSDPSCLPLQTTMSTQNGKAAMLFMVWTKRPLA